MKYEIQKDKILIFDKSEFCPKHILECGQIFSYKKTDEAYIVYSSDKKAIVVEKSNCCEILTDDVPYFVNFFDLDTDYSQIKCDLLKKYPFMKKSIDFGYGIRILKQDFFETIISFIISSNNNIKRIQKILFNIRERFGKNMGDYYSFPTPQMLKIATEQDFKEMGAGYRAKYLVKATEQLLNVDFLEVAKLDTMQLNKFLLSIMGVGQKVADCIMLFAFAKQNVFPVDTWIEKVYCTYFEQEHNRDIIHKKLIDTFGDMSGYAQQYLFYSQREIKE